jgi:PAS domain S-box-containing protein
LKSTGDEQDLSIEQLRESEALFRHLAENASVIVFVVDQWGACRFLSRSWYEFTGQAPDGGLQLGWVDALHPDDRVDVLGTYLAAAADRRPYRVEYRPQDAMGPIAG